LEDDSVLAVRSWIENRTAELPAGFASDVRAWLLVLLDGDSRAKPRSRTCAYVYFGGVRPLLENWATTRGHLREITVTDVIAGLSPLCGWQRRNAIAAPRSLFRFAKKRGLIFANPTTRLKTEDIQRNNALAESFWQGLKRETMHPRLFSTMRQARLEIFQ
jgi:hypothetical protein